jgi:predicted metal-dependent phosphoesterase TrpH
MGYDLHIHSTFSDGTYRPEELVAKALVKRLSGIAITDHDTIAGLPDGAREAEKRGLRFITGVELTTDWGDDEVHILGYGFALHQPQLENKLERVLAARNDRARQIVAELNRKGVPLAWERVKAQTTSKFVGRTHIYKALEAAGQIAPEHRQNAFEYYLGHDGLAYVPHQEIGTLEAIELINECGGLAVLAHPGRMGNDELIKRLVDGGLRGIEVFYPSHTPEMVRFYLEMAKRYRLVVTGGSDYHGVFSRTQLGEAQVEAVSWLHHWA